jgi:hypothetical protein
VFDLIREHNLFTDVQDQVLLLVEFDHELMEKRKKEGLPNADYSDAIKLLVDNIHSIPVSSSTEDGERCADDGLDREGCSATSEEALLSLSLP